MFGEDHQAVGVVAVDALPDFVVGACGGLQILDAPAIESLAAMSGLISGITSRRT